MGRTSSLSSSIGTIRSPASSSPRLTRSAITDEFWPTSRSESFGCRRRNVTTSSSSRHADGPPKMPIATVPVCNSVSSLTLSAASSTARRLRGVLGERAPGFGGHDAAAGADEEIGAERLLELADLLGHRGLRHPQRLGRGRVESYPFRLPLSVLERVAFARAGLKVQLGVRRYHAADNRYEFENDRTFEEFLGPLPPKVREIFTCAAH